MKNIATRTPFLLVSIGASMLLAGCLDSGSDEAKIVDDPVPPPPAGNNAPTISGSPSASVTMGNQYSFTPSASDPDNDPLTFSIQGEPNWLNFNSGNGSLAGTPTLADVGVYPGIALSVSDGSLSSSLPQFTVTVVQNSDGSITLTWTAPTENEDGSALTDLTAYKFYYGTSPGNYSDQVRVDSPGITSYVLENLTPATYYVAATAINSSGIESRFSNEATVDAL